MSQQKKLERILTLLVNEEIGQAEELLHDLVVEKARCIYEELVNDEDESEEEMDDEIEESFGGDPKGDFVDNIRAGKTDISSDELYDGEVDGGDEFGIEGGDEFGGEEFGDEGGDEFGGEEFGDEGGDEFGGEEFGDEGGEFGEMDVEDKVENLEAQLAELRAEFDQLMGNETDEFGGEEFGDEGGEFGDEFSDEGGDEFGGEGGDEFGGEFSDNGSEEEEEEYEESYMHGLEEATNFLDPVSAPSNKEGQLVGTGKNSKTGATQTQSQFTKAPTKSISGANPVDFGKGGDEKGGKGDTAKDDTISDNIKVEPKTVSHGEQKTEGDFVGTGKNSKKGAVNSKSPLSTAPKKP